jgi:ribonuclease D
MRYNQPMMFSSLNSPVWVDHPTALQRMVNDLKQRRHVAVDTESNSLFAYKEQVCLIQISNRDTDYLVDPLALSDLSPLGQIFIDANIEKIFHAAEYDLICLKRDFGFQFSNIFDTMIAARTVGREALGLGALLKEHFDVTLDKRNQRANWGKRPLPPSMLAYARLDSHYLIPLRYRLKEELLQKGRWELAREDFARQCSVAVTTNGSNGNGNGACWKVAGEMNVPPRIAAVLQALCAYRDQYARTANLPIFKVISNEMLLKIALEMPLSREDLEKMEGVPRSILLRHGNGLLTAVDQGLSADPPARPTPSRRPSEQYLARIDALRAWRKQAAQKMGVLSDVILPRDVLYNIAQANPQQPADLQALMPDLPWRFQSFGKEILQVVNGLRSDS